MPLANQHTDVQSQIKRFVSSLAGKGCFEQYWVRLHGKSLNRAEKETVIKYSIPTVKGAAALDAGCGEGRITFPLALMYEHVYAMDFSQLSCKQLEEVSQNRGVVNITTRSHDILASIDLPLVNTIVLVQVLQHFDNRPDRIKALTNLRKCLKVGGRVLITVFNHDRIWNKLRFKKQDVHQTNGYPYFHYFKVRELKNLLHEAGFENIRVRGCLNLPAFLHELVGGNVVWRSDVKMSAFPPSKYLGIYLLATAERGAKYRI